MRRATNTLRPVLRKVIRGFLPKWECSCGGLSTLLWMKAYGHMLAHGVLLPRRV